jgi:glycosyltransferase involved in cell wall biosynthesis
LDAGYANGTFSSNDLQVTNLGADYTGTEARHDYQELALLPRDTALDRARRSQVLLLVQHADDRSLETIPFKLYDYLNLGVPILVIGRNPEIRELLSDGDFFCYVENQQSIVQAIASLLKSSRSASEMRGLGAVDISRPAPDSYVKAWEALVA